MKYPKSLKENGCIGLVAPSHGVSIEPYVSRYKSACKKFIDKGYTLKESDSLYSSVKAASNTCEIRAKEWLKMYEDTTAEILISVGGGETMLEILPYIDFQYLKQLPAKYFCGFSDNTVLTFTLTTICDIASIYGYNFPTFGMSEWHESIKNLFDFLTLGKTHVNSYPFFEGETQRNNEGKYLDTYNLTEKTFWQSVDCNVKGRMLGGCLDLLTNLCGTKFDKVSDFNNRYSKDGVIWYLECCDLTVLDTLRSLWQLKNAGWFSNANAIIFGRPLNRDAMFDISYEDAIYSQLSDLNIPLILDTDIGHIPPTMFILNGSLANIKVEKNKGSIEYFLE